MKPARNNHSREFSFTFEEMPSYKCLTLCDTPTPGLAQHEKTRGFQVTRIPAMLRLTPLPAGRGTPWSPTSENRPDLEIHPVTIKILSSHGLHFMSSGIKNFSSISVRIFSSRLWLVFPLLTQSSDEIYIYLGSGVSNLITL